MRDVIVHGDALAVLKTLEDNSIDALVTDPPAGISFMGKEWDNPDYFPLRDRGERLTGSGNPTASRGFANNVTFDSSRRARDAFIAFMRDVMAEALRCVRPGGHALVWALPRTSHWTATALEDAGWEIRDCLTHLFGSGFPKSHDISKAIDKLAGAEREVLGVRQDIKGGPGTAIGSLQKAMKEHGARKYTEGLSHDNNMAQYGGVPITAPATPDAQRWHGYGSALKPASEHWILCRKPLAAANLASNVLQWGTGGLNIDSTRVQGVEQEPNARARKQIEGKRGAIWGNAAGIEQGWNGQAGRWPPNFLLSHAPECQPDLCAEGGAIVVPSYVVENVAVTPFDDPSILLDRLAALPELIQRYSTTCSTLLPHAGEFYRSGHKQSEEPSDGLTGAVGYALAVSRVLGSLSDCPACSCFCDEQLHQVLMACQDGVPSLLDALARVHQALSQFAHILPAQHNVHPSNSDDLLLSDIAPGTTENNNTGASYLPRHGVGKPSHKRGKPSQESLLSEQLYSIQVSNTAWYDVAGGTADHTACRAASIAIVTFLAYDLSYRYLLPACIIHQSEIHINLPQCPVRLLDEQAQGMRASKPTNSGRIGWGNGSSLYFGPGDQEIRAKIAYDEEEVTGPSRFFPVFYAAKASRRERNAGCEGLPVEASSRNGKMPGTPEHGAKHDTPEGNNHPTVKSLSLMSWLVRLITPPGGTVLDCFAGSGSTLVACVQEGFHYIGIEQQADYVEICKARLAHASRNAPLARPEAQQVALPAKIIKLPRRKKHTVSELQLSLFA